VKQRGRESFFEISVPWHVRFALNSPCAKNRGRGLFRKAQTHQSLTVSVLESWHSAVVLGDGIVVRTIPSLGAVALDGGIMRAVLIAVTVVFSASFASAGTSSVVIAVGYNPSAPTVRMQVPADFVAMPIHVQNDSKDAVKRADEIEKALRSIADTLHQYPDITLKQGVVSLSAREQSALKSFSSYDSSTGSSAQLYLLGALKQDTNVFAVTKRLYQAVSSIPLGEGTKFTLGNTTLGLNEPEKYRAQILESISKSIAESKKSLGLSGSVDVEGLENPVSVMQLNEAELALFINYRLSIQTKTP